MHARFAGVTGSSFVPTASGHANCSLVLPPVDEIITASRRELNHALADGSTDGIVRAFTNHEATVVEADAVYRALDSVHTNVSADLGLCTAVISNYLGSLLDGREHELAITLDALGKCESRLAMFCGSNAPLPLNFTNEVAQLATAMENLMKVFSNLAPECVKPLLDSQHMTSLAWRVHGFQTPVALGAHSIGQIPASAQNHLVDASGVLVRRGSAMVQAAWEHLNTKPTGVRLGMAIRYSSMSALMSPLLLCEQLLVPESHSLLDSRLYRRFHVLLYDKPNAGLPIDKRIPLLAIMYSALQPITYEVAVKQAIHKERSAAALNKIVELWLADTTAAVGTSPESDTVPHVNKFCAMAQMWCSLVREINPPNFEDLDQQCLSWPPNRSSLYMIVRALYSLRDSPRQLVLLSRVFWWARYAKRGTVDESRFYDWQCMASRVWDDLHAFVISTSLFSGSTWSFVPHAVSSTCPA